MYKSIIVLLMLTACAPKQVVAPLATSQPAQAKQAAPIKQTGLIKYVDKSGKPVDDMQRIFQQLELNIVKLEAEVTALLADGLACEDANEEKNSSLYRCLKGLTKMKGVISPAHAASYIENCVEVLEGQ